ncbi:HDOD domain-containing protein [Paracidovorax citrulli]|uniref:Signal transduction protein n=2 Tax=Paracidovorax citrulli TaxID=80869 RepID=A1TSN9_PARC0|nr:HDOD domain-containing protein [Paracidovorax citrulli]ABM33977.1 putative signal transduction protein [Paracidovorax citrulli AAC00-1]ATG96950.1 HDOD domain-containing protein [Paracidovorax citrulli]MVT38691.1 HDOD domain-containing protein [Paracidovorax citrulli]UEG44732.1 HDOD domain-containing protein [Paracidovorax citrulli]UMT83872.1 HDOD domain-containing protein [Paracidovorax citrulli]
MELNALLEIPVALPSHPRAVALLMAELSRAEPSLRRLTQIFGTDPALAARLLELANGPEFEVPRAVCGVPEALALVGIPQVRALVGSAPPGTTSRSVPGVNLQQFWRYSLHTAKMARSLAGVVRHNPMAGYTAGLLHGLGELLIHLGHPERLASVDSVVGTFDPRRAVLEHRLLGYGFGAVSAAMARRWQLPQVVVDALQYQHAPFENSVYEPLAGVLHLAAWRAWAREAGWGDKELAVSFPAEVGLPLGLDIDMVLQQDPIDWTAPVDAGAYLV